MIQVRFAITLTKPKSQKEKAWIRVSTDTGFIYVNVGNHGRFYGNLADDAIRVAKSTVGTYKITYRGPWETEQGKPLGNAVIKNYYFTVTERDRVKFEKAFKLGSTS